MGSHSVTCHPTEVNLPTLLPGIHQYSFYRPLSYRIGADVTENASNYKMLFFSRLT